MFEPPITESVLRRIRNDIFGHPQESTPESQQRNWDACKENWWRDRQWLIEEYLKKHPGKKIPAT